MPPDGKYVLIRVQARPWHSSTDNYGVFWKVAKCVYGISAAERERLSKSDICLDQKRSKQYWPADEQGNNKKPYYFTEFGPGSFFGQEVDEGCELPGRETIGERKVNG